MKDKGKRSDPNENGTDTTALAAELARVKAQLQVALDACGIATAQMKDVQRLAKLGSWEWEIATDTVTWSEELCHICGVNPEEFGATFKAVIELVHSDDRTLLTQIVDEALINHKPFSRELRIIRPDGEIVVVQSRGAVVVDETGRASKMLGTVQDVTESRRIEEQLRQRERFILLITDLCPVVLGVFDVSTERHSYFNRGVIPMFGYTPDEMIQMKDSSALLIHPDDHIRRRENISKLKQLKNGQINEFECRVRSRDGEWRWVVVRSIPFRRNSKGDLKDTVDVTFDITERKRAEEALKAARDEMERRVAERTQDLTETLTELQEKEETRKNLLRRIVSAQEEEQTRIARDLHDHFGQQLTVLLLDLGILKQEFTGQPNLCQRISNLEVTAKDLNSELDVLVRDLRPSALDNLGLGAALGKHVQAWSRHFGIPAELLVGGMETCRLAADVETALYRIAQEALNNVAKHARAESVAILLDRHRDYVSLIIEDNGVGFDGSNAALKGQGRLGVVGMGERAALVGGTVVVESRPGDGVTVFVRVPSGVQREEEKRNDEIQDRFGRRSSDPARRT